jgi:hypothetical protein
MVNPNDCMNVALPMVKSSLHDDAIALTPRGCKWASFPCGLVKHLPLGPYPPPPSHPVPSPTIIIVQSQSHYRLRVFLESPSIKIKICPCLPPTYSPGQCIIQPSISSLGMTPPHYAITMQVLPCNWSSKSKRQSPSRHQRKCMVHDRQMK